MPVVETDKHRALLFLHMGRFPFRRAKQGYCSINSSTSVGSFSSRSCLYNATSVIVWIFFRLRSNIFSIAKTFCSKVNPGLSVVFSPLKYCRSSSVVGAVPNLSSKLLCRYAEISFSVLMCNLDHRVVTQSMFLYPSFPDGFMLKRANWQWSIR